MAHVHLMGSKMGCLYSTSVDLARVKGATDSHTADVDMRGLWKRSPTSARKWLEFVFHCMTVINLLCVSVYVLPLYLV